MKISIRIFLFLVLILNYSCNKTEIYKYNYIVIFTDDMGYGDIGVYGHPTINTPYLDKMSVEGQKWTQFYSAASVCTPSRAALLTGRLPVRSGMASSVNRVLFPNSKYGIPKTEILIAEKLKDHDYKTAIVGKWHLGHNDEFLPLNHGFDYYYGIPYSNDMDKINNIPYWSEYEGDEFNSKNYNVPLMENFKIIERPADQTTITKRFSQKVVELVNHYKEDNFFIYLAHSLPHIPLYASDDFLGKSKRGLYGDVIEEIDFGVGQILSELKKLKLDKNTIVVFTSDNGPWLTYKTHGGSAGLLRDGKGTTWEGGMRVPAIFWGADIVSKSVNEMGSTLDLYPTFMSISNISYKDDNELDGIDLSDVLFSNGSSSRVVMPFYNGSELYAFRYKNYKLHLKTSSWFSKVETHDPPMLFDLEIDPSEKYNISEENPEKINEILKIINIHKEKIVFGNDQLKSRD
ncbi:MAG: sulfatase [Candidatus Marinimicrobia bacterium]|nr:sulfatase [Candidatus Neomarinimicrobiota bacterium]